MDVESEKEAIEIEIKAKIQKLKNDLDKLKSGFDNKIKNIEKDDNLAMVINNALQIPLLKIDCSFLDFAHFAITYSATVRNASVDTDILEKIAELKKKGGDITLFKAGNKELPENVKLLESKNMELKKLEDKRSMHEFIHEIQHGGIEEEFKLVQLENESALENITIIMKLAAIQVDEGKAKAIKMQRFANEARKIKGEIEIAEEEKKYEIEKNKLDFKIKLKEIESKKLATKMIIDSLQTLLLKRRILHAVFQYYDLIYSAVIRGTRLDKNEFKEIYERIKSTGSQNAPLSTPEIQEK